MENMIITLLCLSEINKKDIFNIINNINTKPKDENELFDIIINLNSNYKNIIVPTLDKIKRAIHKSNEIILQSKKQDINCIDILDINFPKKLIDIKNPPLVLFYKGNYETILNNKSVGIIGSRNATLKGLKSSYNLGYIFGSEGYNVISGLAKGCDEQAHKGCLDALGKTIAVLPCGLDSIYPLSNIKLSERILEDNGCLISEYFLDSKISKCNFIQRNKIQSALSDSVIVCEAGINSGTMHTVNFAKSQNKILACVDIDTSGNNKIIKENKCIRINNKLDLEKLKTKMQSYEENKIITKQLKMNI